MKIGESIYSGASIINGNINNRYGCFQFNVSNGTGILEGVSVFQMILESSGISLLAFKNGYWKTIWSTALKSDSTIVNYKDKITSDFISLYNANSQQACVVRQPNGTKFAIINLAFKLKNGYTSGTEKELMIFPSDLVPSSNVVLQLYADKKVGFAYLNVLTRFVTVTIPIDTSSNSEFNLLGYYQIV